MTAKPCPVCGPEYEVLTDGTSKVHWSQPTAVCTPALRSLVREAEKWASDTDTTPQADLDVRLYRAVRRFQKERAR